VDGQLVPPQRHPVALYVAHSQDDQRTDIPLRLIARQWALMDCRHDRCAPCRALRALRVVRPLLRVSRSDCGLSETVASAVRGPK